MSALSLLGALAPSETPLIAELSGVTKTYPGGVAALRGVDLRVEPGELLAIVGPSGSGKSTLLHLLGTLDRPSDGRVAVNGYDVAALSDRELSALRARHIGFVFQQFHLAAGVAARDNVADGLLYRGMPVRERRERAEAALERVGLAHRAGHRPNELSGGEQQRVAIARAVAGGPDLLLADEPTGNLDSTAEASVLEVLRDLHETGTTIAIITHDLDIARLAHRQVRVRDGMIISDTGPDGGPGDGPGGGPGGAPGDRPGGWPADGPGLTSTLKGDPR